jgi:hypothetical protein
MEQTFDVPRRLVTWLGRMRQFSGQVKPDWKKEEDARLARMMKAAMGERY